MRRESGRRTPHTPAAGAVIGATALTLVSTLTPAASADADTDEPTRAPGHLTPAPVHGVGGGSGHAAFGPTGPITMPQGVAPAQSRARHHTVQAGETVSGIAAHYGLSVSAVIRANHLPPSALIRIGERLTIPGSSSGGSSSSEGGSSSSGSASSASSYTVRSGDTVSTIASRHGTTVAAIIGANDLSSSGLIRIGQRLRIPGSSEQVPNTFLHYTYSDDVVSAANENQNTLLSVSVPSRSQMQDMVRSTASQMGVSPALALAVATQESDFDMRAVSPANAVGVMQVIPSSGQWASDLVGRDLNLLDPQDNVTAGVAILRSLVRTSPDVPAAIAGYYQGAASVREHGMYPDTKRYVATVRTLMTRYA